MKINLTFDIGIIFQNCGSAKENGADCWGWWTLFSKSLPIMMKSIYISLQISVTIEILCKSKVGFCCSSIIHKLSNMLFCLFCTVYDGEFLERVYKPENQWCGSGSASFLESWIRKVESLNPGSFRGSFWSKSGKKWVVGSGSGSASNWKVLNPDLHQSEKQDPDPDLHKSDNQESDPH